jgi:UDP-glucose 6-dehydrogenase
MVTKIYGLGWVGKSMLELFPDSLVHDPAQKLIDKHPADIGFVCVPTNLLPGGTLDTSIVEGVVANSKEDLLVIRSTVNPGTCDKLAQKYDKKIVMQPEYLGETPNHPMLDPSTRQFMVIGGDLEDRKQLIDLYATVYNSNITIRQVTNYEAEVIKLTENRAIGFKVMQLHELYKVCEADGLDYYTIRDAVYGDDPRFNLWFSFIYPDNMGFNSSKCLRKDIPAWNAWAESVGFNPILTRTLVSESSVYAIRNNTK